MISCNKEEEGSEASEYYVKYILSSNTIYSGGQLDVEILDEFGLTKEFVVDQKTTWEMVVGPVKRNFESKMEAQAIGNTQDKLTLNAEIHVSKDESAFAIKNTNYRETPRNSLIISYQISY